MYYTYVLSCESDKGDSDFYIGFTADLKDRLNKHRSGATKTTRRFNKIELVYYEACLSESDARKREKQLKTGFGRGYLKRRLGSFLEKRD